MQVADLWWVGSLTVPWLKPIGRLKLKTKGLGLFSLESKSSQKSSSLESKFKRSTKEVSILTTSNTGFVEECDMFGKMGRSKMKSFLPLLSLDVSGLAMHGRNKEGAVLCEVCKGEWNSVTIEVTNERMLALWWGYKIRGKQKEELDSEGKENV
ncbi:hypothetical protein RJT34_25560 [Clitoria ternatea]|uniref:Uncharacterized protein n=1 Tax=Clitoria ternatea TaxID=43366 RepID=A0AAN9ILG4_CLITE